MQGSVQDYLDDELWAQDDDCLSEAESVLDPATPLTVPRTIDQARGAEDIDRFAARVLVERLVIRSLSSRILGGANIAAPLATPAPWDTIAPSASSSAAPPARGVVKIGTANSPRFATRAAPPAGAAPTAPTQPAVPPALRRHLRKVIAGGEHGGEAGGGAPKRRPPAAEARKVSPEAAVERVSANFALPEPPASKASYPVWRPPTAPAPPKSARGGAFIRTRGHGVSQASWCLSASSASGREVVLASKPTPHKELPEVCTARAAQNLYNQAPPMALPPASPSTSPARRRACGDGGEMAEACSLPPLADEQTLQAWRERVALCARQFARKCNLPHGQAHGMLQNCGVMALA